MPTDTPADWQELYDAMGGRARLAAALRVDDSTIYRWSRSRHAPSSIVRRAVNALCDQHNVPRVFDEPKKEDTHA